MFQRNSSYSTDELVYEEEIHKVCGANGYVIRSILSYIHYLFSVEVSTLFRATTLATTLMDQYMKMTSTDFVRQALLHGVQKVMELKHPCEVCTRL